MMRQNAGDCDGHQPGELLACDTTWDDEQRQIDDYLSEIGRLVRYGQTSGLDCELMDSRSKIVTFLIETYLLDEKRLFAMGSSSMLAEGLRQGTLIRALLEKSNATRESGADRSEQFDAVLRLRKALRLHYVTTNLWRRSADTRKS